MVRTLVLTLVMNSLFIFRSQNKEIRKKNLKGPENLKKSYELIIFIHVHS